MGMLRVVILIWAAIPLWASKEIVVDLSRQKAYAYEGDRLLFEGRISSGMAGRETPVGVFKVLEKKRYHRSNLWPKPHGGAKMHYMLRLTYDGIAMHLGYVPNRPASHGCVRMKNGFAQKMFRWAEKGIPVIVKGKAPQQSGSKSSDTYTTSVYDDTYGVIDFHD